ncbi:ESPR domain-containing protein [Parasutterella sp.]|uniref:ESPR domain-containing protein n=1 Tax=Parasutterella sp. TaxID=2049037 RepID=UPI0035216805
MNKNFKVIFNRARGLLVVANECARSVGKSKSIVTSASAVAMCVLVGGYLYLRLILLWLQRALIKTI